MSQHSAITNFDDGTVRNPATLYAPPSPLSSRGVLTSFTVCGRRRVRSAVFYEQRPANGMTPGGRRKRGLGENARGGGAVAAGEIVSNRVTD